MLKFRKNRALLRKHAQKFKLQSVSIHNPVKGDLAFHDNLIPLYLPGCNNPGVNSEYWGTMLKAEMDGKRFVFITHHQLRDGCYYKTTDGKVTLLPKADKWELYGNGNLSFYRIPADKLVGIPKGQNMKVSDPQKGSNFVAMYVGYNPATLEKVVGTTPYSYAGGEVDIVHSCSTQNFSCGSFLFDTQLNAIVGLHHGSLGPAAKRGNNNMMIPLKSVGLRQVATP